MEKPGVARPLIIPRYNQVGKDIITNLIRTAGITRDAFLSLLERQFPFHSIFRDSKLGHYPEIAMGRRER